MSMACNNGGLHASDGHIKITQNVNVLQSWDALSPRGLAAESASLATCSWLGCCTAASAAGTSSARALRCRMDMGEPSKLQRPGLHAQQSIHGCGPTSQCTSSSSLRLA